MFAENMYVTSALDNKRKRLDSASRAARQDSSDLPELVDPGSGTFMIGLK